MGAAGLRRVGRVGRLTYQVCEDGVAQQHGEAHEGPGQEWCLEVE